MPTKKRKSASPPRADRARFIAGYQLKPATAVITAVSAMRARLDIVSEERIRAELDKLLVVEEPGPGLWFLVDTGLAEEFLPELPALGLEQDPIHRHKDVLAHTIAVVERTPRDRVLRLAALLHDIGKPKTRSFGANGVTFHHHEVVGARMARERMQALRYSNDDVADVTRLVELHLRFHGYHEGDGGWTDSAVRRYARDAGPLLDRLNVLTRADCTTRNKAKARMLAERMDLLEARIEELREREELAAVRPEACTDYSGPVWQEEACQADRGPFERQGFDLEWTPRGRRRLSCFVRLPKGEELTADRKSD